jgi:hypothetical protein
MSFFLVYLRFSTSSIERSTYVLASSLVLLLLYWLWRPMTDVIWSVANPAGSTVLWALFWIGWMIVLISTFLINLRFVRTAAGLCALARQAVAEPNLSDAAILQICASSDLFRFPARVLGDADDDSVTPVVCNRDDRLHPHWHISGGTRFGYSSWRRLHQIPRGSVDDPADATEEKLSKAPRYCP